jgi:membrane-bound metal-dependent hydrolase YbcI (DUF457 family)
MASSWTHAVGAIAIAAPIVPRTVPPRTWIVLALAAALPDVDAIGRPFGAGDVAWLGGHRALTHSIAFAAALSAVLSLSVLPLTSGIQARLVLWLALTLAIASHGGLDSLTTSEPTFSSGRDLEKRCCRPERVVACPARLPAGWVRTP